MNNLDWTVLDTPQDIAEIACEKLSEIEQEAISKRGVFRIVLAGGSTPKLAYQMLAKQQHQWSAWQVFFGDERCLPADDPQRNSVMAENALLQHVAIADNQIHIIPAELGAQKAAKVYTKTIQNDLPFDLVLLGLGEDGHTASLFPGHAHAQNKMVVAVKNAPKPPAERVSLSKKTLSQCRHLIFLVAGAGKHHAVQQWRNGEPIPAAEIGFLQQGEVLLDGTSVIL